MVVFESSCRSDLQQESSCLLNIATIMEYMMEIEKGEERKREVTLKNNYNQ